MRGRGISTRVAVLAAALAVLALPGSASAATITPNIFTDELVNSGPDCSLREAVESMNMGGDQGGCVAVINPNMYGSNNLIRLPPGSYVLSIDGPGEDMNQTGDLDLRSTTAIDSTIGMLGNPDISQTFATDDRIIDIPITGVTVSLNNLTVKNGEATGASPPGNSGGNILFRGSGALPDILQLVNVDVLNGLAKNSGGGFGGGIAATGGGLVLVEGGSLIQDNEAGFSVGSSYFGGGIFITGTGTDLTVTNSSVTQNEAGVSDGATSVTSGQGGGIWDEATNTTLDLSGSTIDLNVAGGGFDAVQGLGGGVGVNSNSATITIGANTNITSNQAGGGFTGAHGTGGGIYASGGGTSTLSLGNDDVVVDLNEAGGGGSGFTSSGGGIYTEMPTTITGASISSNNAGVTGANGGGGGIHMDESNPATLMITGSTLVGNEAGTAGMGGIGGGILTNNTLPLTISGSRIANNTTPSTGGGVYRAPAISGAPDDSISTSLISGNSANLGGGLYWFTDGSLSLLRSTVSMNTATADLAPGKAGGLDLNPATNGALSSYLIENSTIDNNTAANFGGAGGEGGGVNLHANAANIAPVLTVRSSTISDNTAAGATAVGGNMRASSVTVMGSNLIELQGSIVTGGVAGGGGENCSAAQTGTFQSLGGNVESLNQCELLLASDRPSMNPMLGPLQPNGGPMVGQSPGVALTTRAITSSSPAFNLVPLGLCPPSNIDEVGTSRPQPAGGACDAGAFEVLFVPPVITPPATPPIATPTTPTTTAPKKKCKKKKRKGAAAAKKCKKRK